jgi:diadenosine tetraphosphate (Ap4A) HIT family hydrolase
VNRVKEIIRYRIHPDGYNIGVNIGEVSGQTIPHVHIHLIPRYQGDVRDPRGGIRGVIPRNKEYPFQL